MANSDSSRRRQEKHKRDTAWLAWYKPGALVIALVAALWLAGVGAAPAQDVSQQEAPPVTPLLVPISPLLGASLPNLEGRVVLDGSTQPLAGIEVTAYQREAESWRPVRRTTTNVVGYFRFPRMSAGVYRLLAQDPDGVYAPIYYPAAPQIDLANNVPVVAETVAGIELGLTPGGVISGTVAWTDGPSPFGVEVTLYRWRETSGPSPDVVTNSALASNWSAVASIEDVTGTEADEGTGEAVAAAPNTVDYGFRGLAAGLYRVCATAGGLLETRSECYGDALLGSLATGVALETGAEVTHIDIDLGESAGAVQLTGRVTSEGGTPAVGVEVNLMPEGIQDFGPTPSGDQTSTDANGVYTFTRLLPGAYTLTLDDVDEGRYLPLTYIAPENPSAPGVLQLMPGEARVIDAIVSPAAIISGYVTLNGEIPGVNGQIYPYQQVDGEYAPLNLVSIDPATGAFRVSGLTAGTYVLQVLLQPVGANLSFFAGGADPSQATPYGLTPGQQITDVSIDAAAAYDVLPFGQITGMVTLDGTPQAGVRVELYRSPDRNRVPPPTVYVETDAEGRYRAVNLPPGDYLVGFVDPNGVYATVYYPNAPTLAQADTFSIGLPEPDSNWSFAFGNVDANLTPAGSVARTAQRNDGTPLVGVEVVLFRDLGEQGFVRQAGTRTNAEGEYRFDGLVPGPYRACIAAPGAAGPECADLGVSGQAVGINVLAGVASTGVDTVIETVPEAIPETGMEPAPGSTQEGVTEPITEPITEPVTDTAPVTDPTSTITDTNTITGTNPVTDTNSTP